MNPAAIVEPRPCSGRKIITEKAVIGIPEMTNDLCSLTPEELLSKTKSLVARERELTIRVIEHLEEIERRKLFLDRGFPSLFEFCLSELGYSESQAHRRISAMRLSREIPETKHAIESGALTLASVAMAQQFFRQEQKLAGTMLGLEEKREVLRDLSGKSKRESERMLAERSRINPHPVGRTPPNRKVPLPGGRTRVEVVFSHEQLEKFQKLQALLSHQASKDDWAGVLEKAMDSLPAGRHLESRCRALRISGPTHGAQMREPEFPAARSCPAVGIRR